MKRAIILIFTVVVGAAILVIIQNIVGVKIERTELSRVIYGMSQMLFGALLLAIIEH